jgi:manganese transport protein
VRIVEENNIDLLVIGSHGHKGLKDIVYGQTVSSVRHELKIPVLVINV